MILEFIFVHNGEFHVNKSILCGIVRGKICGIFSGNFMQILENIKVIEVMKSIFEKYCLL